MSTSEVREPILCNYQYSSAWTYSQRCTCTVWEITLTSKNKVINVCITVTLCQAFSRRGTSGCKFLLLAINSCTSFRWY